MELLAGNVKWIVDSDIIAGEFIANGQLKPLAIVGKHRIQKYPSVPTLTELGVNDYGIYRWFILVSNSDADPVILDYVKSKIINPDFKKKINDLGVQTENPEYIKYFFPYEIRQTKQMLKKIQLE
jgi:tripartite-type tricarboxylate transporter receptor subunit TctC